VFRRGKRRRLATDFGNQFLCRVQIDARDPAQPVQHGDRFLHGLGQRLIDFFNLPA
jgi:hypothetical protein